MRTGAIIEANRALAFVRAHAVTLGHVEMPRLVGRSAAKANLAALMTDAARDADRAATTLLGIDGFSAESVDAIRSAVRMLEHGPPDARLARRAAAALRDSADTAEASWASSIARDPDLARAQLAQLMSGDPDTLAAFDWKVLRRLLAVAPEDGARGLRRIEGAPTFEEVAARHESLRSWTRADMTDARQYFAAWRLSEMPSRARVEARELLQRRPGELATDDWRLLLTLLDSDPHGRVLPRTRKLDLLPGVRDIVASRAKAPLMRAGKVDVRASRELAAIEHYQAAWRLEGSTSDQRIGLLRELVERDPAGLDQRDWANLHALLRDDTLGLRGPRHLEGLLRLDEIAGSLVERPSARGWYQINRYFSAWRGRLDPDYPSKIAAALDDVARGSSSPDARRIVAAEGHRLAELVAGRAPDQQAAIASVMLEIPDIAATRSVRGTLEMLRGGLATSHPDAKLDALRAETLELVERNLSRLTGAARDEAARGWRNHPDYTEIGRIRENVTLLDLMSRAQRTAASGVETLRW